MAEYKSAPPPAPRWAIVLLVAATVLLLLFFVLNSCGLFGGGRQPTPTPIPSAGGQEIVITTPGADSTVTSPIIVSGVTRVFPFEGNLNYRLFGPDGALIAQGFFTATGDIGGPGAFAGEVPYTLEGQGPGRIEVIEVNVADGSIRAIATTPVILSPGQGLPATTVPVGPTPLPPPSPAPQQAILIDSPPPGTTVGSPMTVTGRTVRMPAGNTLSFVVRDAVGATIGSGAFPVAPVDGGTGSFNASISFTPPANGGNISLELFEPGAPGQPNTASATLPLVVAPPQAILIDTPPPGTTVGSPVVITGRTARFPFQGALGYRVLDGSGRQLGIGTFPVQGAQGGPTAFTASINFSLPPNGGRVTVEVADQNAADGQVAASARIDLNVSPPQQAITIESPPPGTLVGSPMTVTGRTVRAPAGNVLTYRVRDLRSAVIGQGQFPVTAAQDGSSRFTAQVFFTPPQGGGQIVLELQDIEPSNGQVRASASLNLQVAGGPPPTATSTPQPTSQAITIETPPAGTAVGSPVVITGRVALAPRDGKLFYVVRTLDRQTLGQGEFPVATPRQAGGGIPFVASITFAEPPQGGAIVVEIYDRDAVGSVLANAFVQLQVNPRTPPTATPPTGGQVTQQQLFIETPPPGTVVGSPVVITGRAALPPLDGELDYRVLDGQNNLIGEGSFRVPVPADLSARIPFVASISFTEPAQGGPIRVVIADIDPATGVARAEATIDLTVNPPPYPRPAPRTP